MFPSRGCAATTPLALSSISHKPTSPTSAKATTKPVGIQPRWINHISIRANDPAQVAEFYEKIFELKEAETYRDDGSICMTDGKVKLLLRPRDKSLYRGLREGLDHIGFKVESLERVKEDLAALVAAAPETADGKLGVGGNGKKNEEDFRRCCLGQHFIADPDGVLIDMAES